MATVATRISRALRLIGVIGSGQTPTTNEYSDGLTALNGMLDAWRNDRLMCYALREESLTVSASDDSYTIGAAGDLNTTRPVTIEAVWIVSSGISYAVLPLSDAKYAAIVGKTIEGMPTHYNYKASMSTGTMVFYPVPDGTYSVKILTRVPVTAFSAITDSVALPPGWEDAIDAGLAIRLAPEFEVTPSPIVAEMARDALKGIRRLNSKPVESYNDLYGMGDSISPSHIETDGQ